MKSKAVCALTPEQADRRGVAWVIGSFVLCPCHLPITLAVVAAALSGTAIGALLRGHLYIAGSIISIRKRRRATAPKLPKMSLCALPR